MKLIFPLVVFGSGLLLAETVHGAAILSPGDVILGIDSDITGGAPQSSYPGNENPPLALDETSSTKYLNFGGTGSGFIVTPTGGSSIVRSLLITTANDAVGRDPSSFALYGTNSPIMSFDNGDGSLEPWTLIKMDLLALPDTRFADGPVSSFANSTAYTSYRLLFPTLKGDPLMQVADVRMFGSVDGTGPNLLPAGSPIIAIDTPSNPQSESSSPGNETPPLAIDGDPFTKYLNFGELNSGFIVQPQVGRSLVQSFTITTANDATERDPSAWELFGTNETIRSTNNSEGNGENWTLIDSGVIDLPLDRFTAGNPVSVRNSTTYSFYKMVFTGVRDEGAANSVQFAEIQFEGLVIPEPGAGALAGIGLAALALRRRYSRA
jgi:hypothetical protein